MTRGPAVTAASAVTAVFSGIARLRQARVFHPRGRSFDATFIDAGLLPSAGTGDAVVRVSKAIPTPGEWPDILGIAVRLQGPVDLLFATTGARPGLRHLLVPRTGFMDGLYTTLLPYEVAGDMRVLALRPERAAGPAGVRLDTFEAALPVTFTVLAAPLTGGWRPCGELIVHTRRSTDVPWFDVHEHSLPELRPAGPFQSLRRLAYSGSRRGRGIEEAGQVGKVQLEQRNDGAARAREPERRSAATPGKTEHSERGKKMITAEDVRKLLDSPDPRATLVVERGQAMVLPGGADSSTGLVVAARDDLLSRLDGPPSQADLDRLAVALDTSVAELGG